ncbi:MAG: HAD family hydrolase [Candidatus Poribacteria bacterium]|nr:HAD family hydrolase [Candidatus Poribacteria bacterium]
MLKAITFDFWQTLYADSEKNWRKRQAIRVRRCHAYLNSSGYACTLTEVEFGLEEAYNLVSSLWYQHKGVSVKRCMQRFAEVLELRLEEADLDQLIECLGTAFLEAPPIMIAHVKPVVSRLSETYPLGIISDSALTPGSFARQLMARDGILRFFTAFTFSDETDYTKPQVVQFHSTLTALHAKPTEAVHIGDIFRTDIVGAKNAGMKAIRFSGFNKGDGDDTLSDAVVDDYRKLETVITELSTEGTLGRKR